MISEFLKDLLDTSHYDRTRPGQHIKEPTLDCPLPIKGTPKGLQ